MRRPKAGAARRGGFRFSDGLPIIDPAVLAPTVWGKPTGIVGSPITDWTNSGSAGGSLPNGADATPDLASINGLACADFNGVDDGLRASGFTLAQMVAIGGGYTAFVVVRCDAMNTNNPTIFANDSPMCGGDLWGVYYRSGGPWVAAYHWDGATRETALQSMPIGSNVLLQWSWGGPGTTIQLRVGAGAPSVSAVAGAITTGARVMRLGRAEAAACFVDGLVAEPMIFNRDLTSSEKDEIRRYYAVRYAVAV